MAGRLLSPLNASFDGLSSILSPTSSKLSSKYDENSWKNGSGNILVSGSNSILGQKPRRKSVVNRLTSIVHSAVDYFQSSKEQSGKSSRPKHRWHLAQRKVLRRIRVAKIKSRLVAIDYDPDMASPLALTNDASGIAFSKQNNLRDIITENSSRRASLRHGLPIPQSDKSGASDNSFMSDKSTTSTINQLQSNIPSDRVTLAPVQDMSYSVSSQLSRASSTSSTTSSRRGRRGPQELQAAAIAAVSAYNASDGSMELSLMVPPTSQENTLSRRESSSETSSQNSSRRRKSKPAELQAASEAARAILNALSPKASSIESNGELFPEKDIENLEPVREDVEIAMPGEAKLQLQLPARPVESPSTSGKHVGALDASPLSPLPSDYNKNFYGGVGGNHRRRRRTAESPAALRRSIILRPAEPDSSQNMIGMSWPPFEGSIHAVVEQASQAANAVIESQKMMRKEKVAAATGRLTLEEAMVSSRPSGDSLISSLIPQLEELLKYLRAAVIPVDSESGDDHNMSKQCVERSRRVVDSLIAFADASSA